MALFFVEGRAALWLWLLTFLLNENLKTKPMCCRAEGSKNYDIKTYEGQGVEAEGRE
jgi:hypothetical protein